MNENLVIIFDFIKLQMKSKKVTQKHLASQLGVSVTSMIRYFKGETPMPLDTYLSICDILDIKNQLFCTEQSKVF